jgi:hypothetical protein
MVKTGQTPEKDKKRLPRLSPLHRATCDYSVLAMAVNGAEVSWSSWMCFSAPFLQTIFMRYMHFSRFFENAIFILEHRYNQAFCATLPTKKRMVHL